MQSEFEKMTALRNARRIEQLRQMQLIQRYEELMIALESECQNLKNFDIPDSTQHRFIENPSGHVFRKHA